MTSNVSPYLRWLLPAALLAGAAPAKAAGTCEGQWHFELSRPDPGAEEWLPKGSFCLADRLPKAIDVSLRYRAGGGAEMSGSPHEPADVMTGSGQCKFVFEGKASGLPEENELDIEVPDGTATISGFARCSHADPRKADGTRSGMTVALKVTGTRSSPASAALVAGPDETVAAVLRACRTRTAEDLWNLMTKRFRAEIDQRAASLRQSLPAAELRRIYGYRGPGAGFTGLVYLGQVLQDHPSIENPCADAAQWKVGKTAAKDGGTLTVISRPDGTAFGLRFAVEKRTWLLDQITKTVAKPGN